MSSAQCGDHISPQSSECSAHHSHLQQGRGASQELDLQKTAAESRHRPGSASPHSQQQGGSVQLAEPQQALPCTAQAVPSPDQQDQAGTALLSKLMPMLVLSCQSRPGTGSGCVLCRCQEATPSAGWQLSRLCSSSKAAECWHLPWEAAGGRGIWGMEANPSEQCPTPVTPQEEGCRCGYSAGLFSWAPERAY